MFVIPLRILGIVGAVVAYPFIAASIALSPWFDIFNNALSDLGNTTANGSVGYVYNAGLILAGTLVFLFALLLSRENPSWQYLSWTTPLMIVSLDLILVGVFSENTGSIHGIVSEIFSAMIIITMLIYSYASWTLERPQLGAIALLFGISSSLISFIRWPWSGVAIQETTISGLAAIWLILVASPMRLPAWVEKYRLGIS